MLEQTDFTLPMNFYSRLAADVLRWAAKLPRRVDKTVVIHSGGVVVSVGTTRLSVSDDLPVDVPLVGSALRCGKGVVVLQQAAQCPAMDVAWQPSLPDADPVEVDAFRAADVRSVCDDNRSGLDGVVVTPGGVLASDSYRVAASSVDAFAETCGWIPSLIVDAVSASDVPSVTLRCDGAVGWCGWSRNGSTAVASWEVPRLPSFELYAQRVSRIPDTPVEVDRRAVRLVASMGVNPMIVLGKGGKIRASVGTSGGDIDVVVENMKWGEYQWDYGAFNAAFMDEAFDFCATTTQPTVSVYPTGSALSPSLIKGPRGVVLLMGVRHDGLACDPERDKI